MLPYAVDLSHRRRSATAMTQISAAPPRDRARGGISGPGLTTSSSLRTSDNHDNRQRPRPPSQANRVREGRGQFR